MSNGQGGGSRPGRSGIGRLGMWGAPTLIILTAAGLILVAWFLWRTTDSKAQGAALALVGVVAGHLLKEVQELVRFWLKGQ
jgi:hypothetical protein